jgi:hypothetical protein
VAVGIVVGNAEIQIHLGKTIPFGAFVYRRGTIMREEFEIWRSDSARSTLEEIAKKRR